MTSGTFECKQCGRCCRVLGLEYEICLGEADVRRWERQGRRDLLAWVDQSIFSDSQYDFPLDPRTDDLVLGTCPFLRKVPRQGIYVCLIHDTKPADCVAFPATREDAERIGCLGYG
jgi:Fe-S-cluster containining protein